MSGKSQTIGDFVIFRSSQTFRCMKTRRGRCPPLSSWVGIDWDGREITKSPMVWEFPDIWKPGFSARYEIDLSPKWPPQIHIKLSGKSIPTPLAWYSYDYQTRGGLSGVGIDFPLSLILIILNLRRPFWRKVYSVEVKSLQSCTTEAKPQTREVKDKKLMSILEPWSSNTLQALKITVKFL